MAKKTRNWKRIAKKDRKNLKLWAEGARDTILRPHIPGYTDALERGWRFERDYVREVCNEFHARISWRLQDDEEPELPLPDYDPFASREEEELDEEEAEQERLRKETLNAAPSRDFNLLLLRRKADAHFSSSPPSGSGAGSNIAHDVFGGR
ncbi:hypothetical protein R3P38DRAFT_3214986 [Favolaschia claudopus]|uniref:Uncharacterized protein n=1 Tax=Favolaschia claudopus TaxID=2862362 RepID=A0AAW0AB73_9AGAR